MPNAPQDEQVTTLEACEIIGGDKPLDRSTVVRMVLEHKLVPARKLPGKSGSYLFWLTDIEAIRDERAARKAAAS